MKKLFLAMAMSTAVVSAAFAESYKLNETVIEEAFAQADDISLNIADFDASVMSANPGEITKGGYLLRAFFCGSFALHRKYMGNGGKTLWYYYLCIPIVGGVVGCVDFWGVVIKGDEFWNKFKDNSKFIVWSGGK